MAVWAKGCLRECCHNLTSWLVPSFLAFITFMVPLADLLPYGDDPKSLTQLAKNEVFSNGTISSLMTILHNQFCHPGSSRQNDLTFGVVGKELCELETPVTPDDAIFYGGLSWSTGFPVVSGYPSSKLLTCRRMLWIMVNSLSPLQHPLFLQVTI